MQKSGKLMLVILPFIAGGELINYLGMMPSYAAFYTVPLFYFLFLFVIIFIAFQVISSELKINELMDIRKSVIEEKTKQVIGNNNHSSSIAN
jgi:hypothetical protein